MASAVPSELGVVEQFMADVGAGTQRMVASVQDLALGKTNEAVEHLILFATSTLR